MQQLAGSHLGPQQTYMPRQSMDNSALLGQQQYYLAPGAEDLVQFHNGSMQP